MVRLIKILGVMILLVFIAFLGIRGTMAKQPSKPGAQIILTGPYLDQQNNALTVALRTTPEEKAAPDAQLAIVRGLEILSKTDSLAKRKILKLAPGHYMFSRPVMFKQSYQGIELIGAPEITRPFTEKKIEPATIHQDIAKIRPHLPVIDGGGVSSFMVVDGVAAAVSLTAKISGFYFINQMAGLGGNHYPDLSYRLTADAAAKQKLHYTPFVFTDGGVVSVLGNAAINFIYNIVDQPSAYQCGGVLRNEQYGGSADTPPSTVTSNIVLNPFAWHTGAFVDNSDDSYVRITRNQILIDMQQHHPTEMITNFTGGFLIVEDNSFIDARPLKDEPTIGIRILGRAGDFISQGNTYQNIGIPVHMINGLPHFAMFRAFYFLVEKKKGIALIENLPEAGFNFVRPGHWPGYMAPYIRPFRTGEIENDDQIRIAALNRDFKQLRRYFSSDR
ncbi:MAG: hypothetical protein M0036_13920 [Desulfobacteraceae bacterium]|nr:hypothetical protein [Desulfobacteraceae bacterium]